MQPKLTLYVELNRRCNLRCEHCDFWKKDHRMGWSTEKLRWVINEWASIGGDAVVTCGGEASLEGEKFWDFHKFAREAGLRSMSVTNGTRVTHGNVGRWATKGPSEITVSLDHIDPGAHDAQRGAPNWEVAVRALRLLVSHPNRPAVYAMAIVSEVNYRRLPEMFELVLGRIGADKLKLNMAQPGFGWRDDDQWWPKAWVRDPDDLVRVIEACDKTWGIKRNPQWLKDIHMYFESARRLQEDAPRARLLQSGTIRPICAAGERTVWISTKGNARRCPSAMFPGKAIVKPGDLAKFMNEVGTEGMDTCTKLCGISHSVRRTTSTVA